MRTLLPAITILCLLAPICNADTSAADPARDIVSRRGEGKVQLVKYGSGCWQLLVEGKPYLVKGIDYSPDATGNTPESSNEWMNSDRNNNMLCDGPYDAWVDANRNDFQDPDEHSVGDFRLLADMGCNTIRIYHPSNISKEILGDLYRKFGIRVIMGNLMGAYTVGSDADWDSGTDYTDPEQCRKMKENIRTMVSEFRNEPYILMWMLGNENDIEGNYENSTFNNTNADDEPEAYARFVEEVCRMIKEMDPDHPVGVSNAYVRLLPSYGKYAPSIDIVGMNAYSGPFGFGTLWNRIKGSFDRPVLITEYGCDSFDQKKEEENEEYQADYHRRAWKDIEENSYRGTAAGNALGGVVFTWLDKWWLCGSNKIHDVEIGSREGVTIDGCMNDEWMGICSQGSGSRAPFMRQLRKAYFVYKNELWNASCEDAACGAPKEFSLNEWGEEAAPSLQQRTAKIDQDTGQTN